MTGKTTGVEKQKSKSSSLSPNIKLGAKNDAFEREADRVADQVVQRTPLSNMQPQGFSKVPIPSKRKIAGAGREKKHSEEAIPFESDLSPLSNTIQAKPQTGGLNVNAQLGSQIQSALGGGNTMSPKTLGQMNQGFGQDFSKVRIHTDGQAADFNRSLHAKAFTLGNNVFFGASQYQPETRAGQHLIAHELTHTIQQKGNKHIQRKPDLTLPDYDPDTQPEFEAENEYQWENKALLDTAFNNPEKEGNERLLALRNFLFIQEQLELKAKVPALSAEMTPEEVDGILETQLDIIAGELIEADNAGIIAESEREQGKEDIAAAEKLLKIAESDLKKLLKSSPRAKELVRIRQRVDKVRKDVKVELDKAQKSIDWMKHKGTYVTEEGAERTPLQIGWDKRHAKYQGKIDAAQQKVTDTEGEYQALVGPTEGKIISLKREITELRTMMAEKKGVMTASKKAVDELQKLLNTMKKVKSGDTSALRRFKLKLFTRKIDDMNHGELLEEIFALFEADDQRALLEPGYTRRFPDWQRYAVVHLSGMRYRNSHGNWFDASMILTYLKNQELDLKTAEERRMIQAEMEGTLISEGVSSVPKKALKKRGHLSRKTEDRALFDEVLALDASLSANMLSMQESGADPIKVAEYGEVIDQIHLDIAEAEAKMTDRGRKKVQSALAKKHEYLSKVARKRAIAKIEKLSPGQVRGVLELMRAEGKIPEVVWLELMEFTESRVDIEGKDWEEKGRLKNAKGKTPAEEELIQEWILVLRGSKFYRNRTGWREAHRKKLSPSIVTGLMCDQLGSHMQHLRGHSRGGGLRNNAKFYKNQENAGTSGAYFKIPSSVSDLKSGASLFWFGWTKNTTSEERANALVSEKSFERQAERFEKRYNEEKKKYDERNKKDPSKFRYGEKRRERILKRMGNLEKDRLKKEGQAEAAGLKAAGMSTFTPEDDRLPDISHIISPDSFGDDIHVGKLKFKENFKDAEGWTYHTGVKAINKHRSANVLMRVRPNPFYFEAGDNPKLDFTFSKNPKMIKQYMRWTHEATIMYADDSATITFDTWAKYQGKEINGQSTRKRNTADILGKDNVYVGYAPSDVDAARLAPFLDFDTSGMEPAAKEMKDE